MPTKAPAKAAPQKKTAAPQKKAEAKKATTRAVKAVAKPAAPAKKAAVKTGKALAKKPAAKPARAKAAPAAATAEFIAPWLNRPRELSELEAAIKPAREKKAQQPAAKPRKAVAKAKPKKALAKPKPAVRKARPVKVRPTGPAKKKPARRSGLKKVVKVLKQALKVKKPPGPERVLTLRADYGEGARASKDAERLAGVSRQVH